jgi:hypothetical protein
MPNSLVPVSSSPNLLTDIFSTISTFLADIKVLIFLVVGIILFGWLGHFLIDLMIEAQHRRRIQGLMSQLSPEAIERVRARVEARRERFLEAELEEALAQEEEEKLGI